MTQRAALTLEGLMRSRLTQEVEEATEPLEVTMRLRNERCRMAGNTMVAAGEERTKGLRTREWSARTETSVRNELAIAHRIQEKKCWSGQRTLDNSGLIKLLQGYL